MMAEWLGGGGAVKDMALDFLLDGGLDYDGLATGRN